MFKRRWAYLFMFSCVLLSAQEKPLISVLDFESSGVAEMEVLVFTDYLTSHIAETGLYRVVDRSQRQTILNELAFSASGCTDESCQLEVGKILQANQIIIGSLGKVGSRYILNIKLIDVETGETMITASDKYSDIDALVDDSENLISKLLSENEPPLSESEIVVEAPIEEIQPIEVDPEKPEEQVIKPSTFSEYDYSETNPILDLAIPGLSHFKAGNKLIGSIYLVSTVGGVVLFGVSEYFFQQNRNAYSVETDPILMDEFYQNADFFQKLSLGGAAFWILTAAVSSIHAAVVK